MCSTFNPECTYENSIIEHIGNLYCPITVCSGILCVSFQFQSVERSDYPCPQGASMCQVRKIPFEDQTKSFLLKFGQGTYIFEDTRKSIQDVNRDVFCPGKYCLKKVCFHPYIERE